jgi:hypothetical protein
MNEKSKTENQQKKKGFLARLGEKIDKAMKEQSNSSCCCCGPKSPKKDSCS